MTEMTTYFCEICGDTFDNPIDCERHELLCAVVEQIGLADLFIHKDYSNIGYDLDNEMDFYEVKEMLESATRISCKTREAYKVCNKLLDFLGFEEMPVFKDSSFPVTFIWNDTNFYWEEVEKPNPIAATNLASADEHEAILLQIEALLEELAPAELASLAVVITEKVAENF